MHDVLSTPQANAVIILALERFKKSLQCNDTPEFTN